MSYIYIDDFFIRTYAVGKCIRQGLGGGPNSLPWKNSNSLNSHLNFTKIYLEAPPPPPENKIIFRHPPPLIGNFFILDQRMYNNNFIYSLT